MKAAGTHKLPLIIGSDAKPRCFSSWDPLLDSKDVYESSQSSWRYRNKFNKFDGRGEDEACASVGESAEEVGWSASGGRAAARLRACLARGGSLRVV